MAAHRWIVCIGLMLLAGCAARVQPRLDAGLGAGWNNGPVVGGNLGLGKYEGTLAAPPLAGPVPPLSVDAPAPSSSPSALPVAAADGQAGPDLCEGGACVIPAGPTAAPAPAPAGSGGVPLGAWIGGGLLLAVLLGAACLGRAKAVKS